MPSQRFHKRPSSPHEFAQQKLNSNINRNANKSLRIEFIDCHSESVSRRLAKWWEYVGPLEMNQPPEFPADGHFQKRWIVFSKPPRNWHRDFHFGILTGFESMWSWILRALPWSSVGLDRLKTMVLANQTSTSSHRAYSCCAAPPLKYVIKFNEPPQPHGAWQFKNQFPP